MGTKITVKRMRQAVLQFISVGAEQSLKWMSHYQETDAVV